MEESESLYALAIGMLSGLVCVLLIWTPLWTRYKDWQLKRAFHARKRAGARRKLAGDMADHEP